MTPLRVRIEGLTPHHARAGFSCGVRRIDSYLGDALDLQGYGFARAFVAVEPGGAEIRGYYALQTRHVVGTDLPLPLGRRVIADARIPVVDLVMLGVDKPYQGRRVGSMLMADALRRVSRVARDVGIWAIVLEPLNDQAEIYYRALGFDTLIDRTRTMYLAVASI
jgi:GNAT superfamily N-acetyltransferase